MGGKQCNCKKSRCLKLYCECFARGDYCKDCNCVNCENTPREEDRAKREKAISQVMERDRNGFYRSTQLKAAALDKNAAGGRAFSNALMSQIMYRAAHNLKQGGNAGGKVQPIPLPLPLLFPSPFPTLTHPKGCHCKKSECLDALTEVLISSPHLGHCRPQWLSMDEVLQRWDDPAFRPHLQIASLHIDQEAEQQRCQALLEKADLCADAAEKRRLRQEARRVVGSCDRLLYSPLLDVMRPFHFDERHAAGQHPMRVRAAGEAGEEVELLLTPGHNVWAAPMTEQGKSGPPLPSSTLPYQLVRADQLGLNPLKGGATESQWSGWRLKTSAPLDVEDASLPDLLEVPLESLNGSAHSSLADADAFLSLWGRTTSSSGLSSLPSFVWNLSPRQIRILLGGLLQGSEFSSAVEASSKGALRVLSLQCASDLQALAMHAGLVCSVSVLSVASPDDVDFTAIEKRGECVVRISNRADPSCSVATAAAVPSHLSSITSDRHPSSRRGLFWCVTTAAPSSVILVRRLVQRPGSSYYATAFVGNCQKKYCECYQAGIKCSDICRCVNCKNGKECGDALHGRHPPPGAAPVGSMVVGLGMGGEEDGEKAGQKAKKGKKGGTSGVFTFDEEAALVVGSAGSAGALTTAAAASVPVLSRLEAEKGEGSGEADAVAEKAEEINVKVEQQPISISVS